MSDWMRPFVGPFILLAILALLAALATFGMREWASHNPGPSSSNSEYPSRPESTGPIGKTKRIPVSNTKHRNDLPVFITKEALIKYLLAFNRGDTEAIVTTLAADTFPVDDYTHVRVLDYDPAGMAFTKLKFWKDAKNRGSRGSWVWTSGTNPPAKEVLGPTH